MAIRISINVKPRLLKTDVNLNFFIIICKPSCQGVAGFGFFIGHRDSCLPDNFFNIYAKFKKLNVINLKFANFYGPGQQLYRIIPKTIMYILLKKKLEIHGNGKSIRSFIFTEDFCSSIIKALKFGKRGETYNISSNETISIKNLVKKICKKMKYPFNKLAYFSKDRLAKDQKYLLNSKKSLKYLNWKNLISLNEGLDETIQWYKQKQSKLKFDSFKYHHKI
jgi:dTDP-glucose 4,6-dehydratase